MVVSDTSPINYLLRRRSSDRYLPDEKEDLESLIILGQLELQDAD